MFATNSFIILLAFAVPCLVRAVVGPTVPAPGQVYNAGSSCAIAWTGDTNSTSLWKDMVIQLMSGSNLDMQPVITVATSQDGTVDGQFTYKCPQVTPNSAIYFYQFSSSHTTVLAWTGRFAIASSSGQTTPPANAVQPDDGSPIPWGLGTLVNSTQTNASSTASPTSSTANSTSAVSGAPNTIASGTPSLTSVVLGSTSVPLSGSGTAASPAQQSTSGALVAMTAFDIRVLGAAAAAILGLSFI